VKDEVYRTRKRIEYCLRKVRNSSIDEVSKNKILEFYPGMHIVVLGVTGSGKSCTIKTLIAMSWCLLGLEGILVIDFKGEYSSLIENLGGKVVYFGKGGKINPFELAGCHVNDRINNKLLRCSKP
jgi:type IV secretory pathway VirB4 component